MKFLALAATFFAATNVVLTMESEASIEADKKCSEKFPIDDDVRKQLKSLGSPQEAKCYLKCLFEQYLMISEKGEVLPISDETRQRFPDLSEAYDVIDKCSDIKVDDCDVSYELRNCVMKYASEQQKEP